MNVQSGKGTIMAKLTREQALAQASESGDLSGVDLGGVDLSEADLSSVDFRDANLEGTNFRGADLTESEFRDARMNDADFSGAKMARGSAHRGPHRGGQVRRRPYGRRLSQRRDRRGSQFRKADLRAARIGVPNFQSDDPFAAAASFEGADMTWCLFGEVDLTGVDLRNANLSHAYMYETEMRSAMLDGADLSEVRLKRQPDRPDRPDPASV